MDALGPAQTALVFAAALGAGAVNAVAGGGTLLTFPVLVGIGLPSIVANATSSVGLVPGALAGAFGYRRNLADVRSWLPTLVLPSLLGGFIGAKLLVGTPPVVFDRLVPVLLLSATCLFAASEWIGRRLRLSADGKPVDGKRQLFVACAQLVTATYGGYFGAGMGILMLAAFSILNLGTIHRANALKTICGACINGFAAALFIAEQVVDWRAAGIVVAGSTIGGFGGAWLAQRVGQTIVRRVVVLVGVVAAAISAWKEFG